MISRSDRLRRGARVGNVTTITGCSTSGIWLTRSLLQREQAQAHQHDDDARPSATGRLMLKLERNMAYFPLRRPARRWRAGAASSAPAWPSFSVDARIAQHRVARGQPALDHDSRRVRAIALAQRQRDLLQLAVLHAPGICLVAVAHRSRSPAASSAVRRCGLDAAFGIQAGHAAAAASRRRSPPAPRPGASWRWRPGSTRATLPANSCSP